MIPVTDTSDLQKAIQSLRLEVQQLKSEFVLKTQHQTDMDGIKSAYVARNGLPGDVNTIINGIYVEDKTYQVGV